MKGFLLLNQLFTRIAAATSWKVSTVNPSERTGSSLLNESRSAKSVIRGLHYQIKPHDQAKLIRVVDGRILDVALDLRKGSSTFGRWYSIELDSESKKSLLIPRGFAHGFSVLSDKAVIQYKCDRVFNRDAERGISLADPSLGIYWNIDVSKAVISDKDKNNPLFVNAEMNF